MTNPVEAYRETVREVAASLMSLLTDISDLEDRLNELKERAQKSYEEMDKALDS